MARQLILNKHAIPVEQQVRLTEVYKRWNVDLVWDEITENTNRTPAKPKAVRRRYDNQYERKAKACLVCGLHKEASQFPIQNNRQLGACYDCDTPDVRKCMRCHEVKPHSDFYAHSRWTCRSCKLAARSAKGW